jgi:NAD(P)-dependent dehydrogenase (short-subunit alcohol dehydrogenase family)
VVCADIDAAAAEATAAQISAAGGRAAALDLDVRDRSFVDSTIAATVREFGRLDVLLDCVGVSQTAAFLDIDPGEWERVIAVNLTGMFHLGQQAARQMVRQGAGGSIINVTSQLAEVARPERAAYVASEGRQPVADPCDGARTGAARHPRQCDRARPDPDRTDPRELRRSRKARATIAQIPLGRMGQPEDIVGAILFLAADESRWVTGGTVTVDGGYLVQ